jgi:rhodanese-related sulfurtransferase
MKKVSVNEVNSLLTSGQECQVIDVREFSEFDAKRIESAELRPLSNFEKHLDEIDRSKSVYLVCRSGNRARTAAERLLKNGFSDVRVVEGGMIAWERAGLPIVLGESRVWSMERQVRFTAGLVVVLGVALGFLINEYLVLVSGLIGAGLVFAAVTDTCGMAMVLARMPWNQKR